MHGLGCGPPTGLINHWEDRGVAGTKAKLALMIGTGGLRELN